jgi:hypothetical protein
MSQNPKPEEEPSRGKGNFLNRVSVVAEIMIRRAELPIYDLLYEFNSNQDPGGRCRRSVAVHSSG